MQHSKNREGTAHARGQVLDMRAVAGPRLRLAVADPAELPAIARRRHDVYVDELEQYEARPARQLIDAPEVATTFLVASIAGEMVGFVGVTAPGSGRFSLDKHVARDGAPFAFDGGTFEVRALTVLRAARGSVTVGALMYAALRFVQDAGGTRIVAVGRRDVLDMYRRVGLEPAGMTFRSGAVTYDLMSATVAHLAQRLRRFDVRLRKLERSVAWQLPYDFRAPAECYHGGAFFDAIGDRFDDLGRVEDVIGADVLDAWYPPAPAVLDTLREHLEWLAKTSPPTQARGLTHTIAEVRGVAETSILAGGGSSQLIFSALQHLVECSSRVLVLDPTYGEYAHVLERLVGCRVERFTLQREDGYRLDLDALRRRVHAGFDWLIWVNPNNPTGRHVPRAEVEDVLRNAPAGLRIWIDETYVDYAGPDQSLETFASLGTTTIVCKSMSKVYALSGLRVGYLCGPPRTIASLRPLLPPWSVSLPAQLAATRALESPSYYAMRVRETSAYRDELARDLLRLGITESVPGIGNFVMFHLPPDGPDAAEVVATCRTFGLYLRNVGGMGTSLGERALRIAVKDRATNARALAILERALRTPVRA